MASSQTVTYNDPDLYQRAVHPATQEMVVAAKGKFRSELTRIQFSRLWIQGAYESLPRIASVNYSALRGPMTFLTRRNQASLYNCGMELSPDDIVVVKEGSSHHWRTIGPVHWATVSLTPEDLAVAGRALLGRELAAQSDTYVVRPAPQLMSRLVELYKSAAHFAKATPILLAETEVARAVEQTLLHTMVRCLADSTPNGSNVGNHRHTAIIKRLEDLLMANRDRPLYLADICTEIGVAERTLRKCCEEHLGMGPIRYLWLRRMYLAHGALNQARPETATVTEIATGHGFWELGRFAVAYRKVFGELPSVTLSRSPVSPPKPGIRPFDLPAA